MGKREYRTRDDEKRGWGRGPWLDEPDKVVWVDEVTDLDCMLVRGPGGHWCGYVGVGPDHPLHGKDYDYVDVNVHGGLTFAAKCSPNETEATGICHVPEPGRPHDVWWFGFDCAHLHDVSPAYRHGFGFESDYREQPYVEQETARLAAQLAEVAS